MNKVRTADLEFKAAEDRSRLQASLEDLKERVHETFDVEHHLSKHALSISVLVALAAATAGYGFAGMFSRR